jgi:hypothetical protein
VLHICESLERRTLFTALNIVGTSGPDTIKVSVSGGLIHADVNGFMTSQLDGFFDSIVIDAQGGIDRIELDSNGDNPTSISAGLDSDAVYLSPTSLNLDSIQSAVTVNGGGGSTDYLYLDDQSNPFHDSFTLTGNTVARTAFPTLTYSNLTHVLIAGGDNGVTYNVNDTSVRLQLDGGGAADLFNLAAGDVTSLAANVTCIGWGGSGDTMRIDDHTAAGLTHYYLEADSVTTSVTTSGVYFNSTLEHLTLDTATQDDVVHVFATSATCTTNVNTGTGHDTVILGSSGTTPNTLEAIRGPVVVDGGPDTMDTVTLHDNGTAFSDPYTLTPTTVTRPFFGALTYFNCELVELYAEDGNNAIHVTGTMLGTPIFIDPGAGHDDVTVDQTAASADGLTFYAVGITDSAGDDDVIVNPDGTGLAAVSFQASMHLGSLTMASGAWAATPAIGHHFLRTNALTMAPTADLHLGSNDLILDYGGTSPLGTVQNLIKAARNGGFWNGHGILSTAARDNPQHNTTLGAMEATDYMTFYGPAATFDAEPINATCVLVKYTYYGDTNFSGNVNFDDYVRVDVGYNTHLTGWTNGDFDYSGFVNFDDYVLIDIAFNTQSGVLGRLPGDANLGKEPSFLARIDEARLRSRLSIR